MKRDDSAKPAMAHPSFMRAAISLACATLLLDLGSPACAQSASPTLQIVRHRGKLICGVNNGLPGFGAPDDKGVWHGLDIDLCRAIAAAVLGDADKTDFKPVSTEQRFTALQTGAIDVLTRNSTFVYSRDTRLGLDFPAINYYDGQGFLVRKADGIAGVDGLEGAAICVAEGTTTEKNLGELDATRGLNIRQVKFKDADEARRAYDEGRCDSYTADASALAAHRLALRRPEDHVLLPDVISKEPNGPVVRHGDNQWGDVVRWVHFAMLIGEEKGITSANVDTVRQTTGDPEIRRLFSLDEDSGAGLGLGRDWAYAVLKQVGSYGESFARNVGANSRLNIKRGLNALWKQGGLQYAPPVR